MEKFVGEVVVPGDIVGGIPLEPMKSVIGPGLRIHNQQVFVTNCGTLKKKGNNFFYVDCCHQKRYIPVRGELVVGVVVNKGGDVFKVDIGSSEQASLSYLALGATKKNRPDIQVGDLVFAKLLIPSRDMEPELACIDSYGQKEKLGLLPRDGFVFDCSLNLIRKILKPTCPLLKNLGEKLQHEEAIGMNGRIWIKGRNVKETIAIANAILDSEFCSDSEIKYLCDDLLNVLQLK